MSDLQNSSKRDSVSKQNLSSAQRILVIATDFDSSKIEKKQYSELLYSVAEFISLSKSEICNQKQLVVARNLKKLIQNNLTFNPNKFTEFLSAAETVG
ncbi:MAG: hypothetical protein RLN62_02875 [Rickettsiales bacterium]